MNELDQKTRKSLLNSGYVEVVPGEWQKLDGKFIFTAKVKKPFLTFYRKPIEGNRRPKKIDSIYIGDN